MTIFFVVYYTIFTDFVSDNLEILYVCHKILNLRLSYIISKFLVHHY